MAGVNFSDIKACRRRSASTLTACPSVALAKEEEATTEEVPKTESQVKRPRMAREPIGPKKNQADPSGVVTVDVKMEETEEEPVTAEQWLKLGEETAIVEPKKGGKRRWKHDEFIIFGQEDGQKVSEGHHKAS